MTYFEPALDVLGSATRPLSTQEITSLALQRALIVSRGKTPGATMSAALYGRLGKDGRLRKVEGRGQGRARRGSVRWVLA
jgi:HB1, ASXL, restriction endonuclease HTH domain